MGEAAVIARKFGDDQSSLLDHFERLAVEVQLNQAMLSRSLSEPTHVRSQPLLIGQGPPGPPPPSSPPHLVTKKRSRGSGFHKVLKKLIKPIFGRMGTANKKKEIPDAKDPRFWKTFSRSMRL